RCAASFPLPAASRAECASPGGRTGSRRPAPRPLPCASSRGSRRRYKTPRWLCALLFVPASYRLMMRLGRNEDQSDQPLAAAIEHAVIGAGWRQGDFSRAELALFVADSEHAAAFKHVIDFVLPRVGVRRLLLAGLETVSVAEKSLGFED